MKYKVGDKVKIREDLNEEMSRVVKPMADLKGRTTEITDVYDEGDYRISKDSGEWLWTEDMLEPVDWFENLKVGDVLVNWGVGRAVLAKCGKVVLLSEWDDFEEAGSWYTKKELETLNYKPANIETVEIDGKKYSVEEIKDKVDSLD